MKDTQRECTDCGSLFSLFPGKPGLIGQCPKCGTKQEKKLGVLPVGGNMVWSHKTAPELEIKPMKQAVQFAKLQKRRGPGPLSCIVQVQCPHRFGGDD